MDDIGEYLMPNPSLRKAIRDIRSETGIGWDIIEQDYVLSWMLFGISNIEKLKTPLIFKGGTALKKCYFGDYRFSQDLDFSVRGDCPKGEDLFVLIQEACSFAAKVQDDIEFKCNRYLEAEAHPEGQEAFVIHARLPWQREFNTSVKVEVTMKEPVVLEPILKKVIHGYGEKLDAVIMTYCVEEIIAEKIRAILQYAKKLHERGWGRSRVRDYYDLWRIFGKYGNSIDKKIIPNLVRQKCELKKVTLASVDDLFQERLMHIINTEWEKWLSPLVPLIPESNIVVSELKVYLKDVFGEL